MDWLAVPIAIVAALIVLWMYCSSSDSSMSPRSFAVAVIDALRAAGCTEPVEFDEARFCLVLGGDGQLVNLGNFFAEYVRLDATERSEAITPLVAYVMQRHDEIPDDYATARPNVLPCIRHRADGALSRLHVDEPVPAASETVRFPLTSELEIVLAYDFPTHKAMLPPSRLDRWGVTAAEAYDDAVANLRAASHEPFRQVAAGVHRGPWTDSYASSRMLLVDVVAGLTVRGDPVAMVPNRDVLVVTGSDDIVGLGIIADFVAEALEGPRQISGKPFRLCNGTWQVFPPPSSLARRYAVLEHNVSAGLYTTQKELLDRSFRRQGVDVFVADYIVAVKDDTGEVISYCAWTKGCLALLPRTERIALVDPGRPPDDQIVGTFPWEQVEAVVGPWAPESDLDPPRYRIDFFPDDDQVARLVARDSTPE